MYKRDKKKEENNFPFILKGKWFSILERAIFFLEEMIYTPLQTEQCKIENKKNNFLQIFFFYALPKRNLCGTNESN